MRKQKLTRDHILRKAEEISFVLKHRPDYTPHFSIHRDKEDQIDQEYSRLGLAIPKKMAKRAVDRNKIKRLIREAFRLHVANLSSKQDIVVKLKASIGKNTRQRLREKERCEMKNEIAKQFHG